MAYKPFVHLHLHTEYSLLDGAIRIKKLFEYARKMNMPAVAMTDHGNMYGAMDLFHAAKSDWEGQVKKIKLQLAIDEYEAKKAADPSSVGDKPVMDDIVIDKEDKVKYADLYIKPIIGCEFYVVPNMRESGVKNDHLVLIAKNPVGYKNLMKLNSLAWTEGYYSGKAHVDLECIAQHAEGLICLSACIVGRIPKLILEGNYEGAKAYALRLKSMFAEGDFYLEMQDHGIVEDGRALEKISNAGLIRISKETGIQLVVTNDAHYMAKEDAEMHDVLLCIQTAAYLDDENRMRFQGKEFYLKSYDEMAALFPDHLDALDRTVEIADKVNMPMPTKQQLLPPYTPPDKSTPQEYLRKMTMEGLVKRYGTVTDAIRKRAEYELGVVIDMGFAEYYLIVWDFIHYAKTHGIPVGAGRGSGVGSIVAYAIGITNVDPLRYNLIFERFLNKERVSMPDFDVDICSEGREKVIEYVRDRYGRDKVTQIITFGTLAAKQAIKDVARVYRIPFAEVEKITKPIPNMPGICLKGVLGKYDPNNKKEADKYNPMRSNDLIELYNTDSTVRMVVDMAEKLEGMPRNTGMHAAGVVICSEPVADHIPLQQNDGIITTQFPKDQVEELGMLKMDFLGLTNLTDLKKCKEYIKRNTGKDVDFAELGYDDPKVYDLIGQGETDAVFQLEGGGMKKFMRDLHPSSMEDIIAGISLYRPGPMDSIPDYVRNKKNPSCIKYIDPRLEPILSNTYGVIVYQEQVMDIVRVIGGYSYGRADILRRIMSKKKQKEMEIQKHIFLVGQPGDEKNSPVEGAIKRGMSEENAVKLFNDMASFAKYAFNKSHAAAYAVLSYETAYMKLYYPQEFITAVMNDRIDKPDEKEKYLTYLREHGVEILPPSVNHSDTWFYTDGKTVRYGLTCIKGVGEEASIKMVEERERGGEYKSLQDLLTRQETMPNKTMIENLIKAGAMDCFGETRATLLSNYEKITAAILADRKKSASGQLSLFDDMFDMGVTAEVELVRMPEMERDLLLENEKDLLNVYMSGHPLDAYRDDYNSVPFHLGALKEDVAEVVEGDEDGVVEDDSLGQYNNQQVVVAGMINNIVKKPDKNGNDFVSGTLADLTGAVEFVCFSRTYAKYRPLLDKRAIVKMEGRLSYRDNRYSLSVQSVSDWHKNARAATSPVVEQEAVPSGADYALVLTVNTRAEQDKIKSILQAYPGDMAVYMLIGGRYYLADDKFYPSKAALAECKAAVGEGGVVLKPLKK